MLEEGEVLAPETKELVPAVAGVVTKAQLVATNAIEMSAAQADLTSWLKDKCRDIENEITEIEIARDEAREHKWKTSSFSSLLRKAQVRYNFYEKVLAAVEAGYTIVPNFPIDVFAIRVAREYPTEGEQWNRNSAASYSAEKTDLPLLGEGQFVSPEPKSRRYQREITEKDGSKWTKHTLVPTGFKEAEFPVLAAHPVVMKATAEARDKMLFDQIGICPPSGRKRGKGDPLIIGQIIETMPRWGEPSHVVSFLIAWHLDLKNL